MLPTWLPSLYPPARDIARGVTSLRARGVELMIEAHAQGPRTWIIVTAQGKPGGKPIPLRGCWAELHPTTVGCVPPELVRTRLINFRPGGPVTITPDEPIRWEAQVLNEHVRRAVRKLDTAIAIEAYGERRGREEVELLYGDREYADREHVLFHKTRRANDKEGFQKRHPLLALLAQLVNQPRGPIMSAVVETNRGHYLVTESVYIPPPAPFSEVLDAYLAVRQSRKTRLSPSRAGSAMLSQ